jgi:hypothetical protein
MRAVIVSFALALSVTVAVADAVVQVKAMTATTIAEYFIGDGGVRVELEIGLPDLPAFANLFPDEIWGKLGNPPRPLAERLPEFFASGLTISADDGPPIRARVLRMEPRDRIRRDEVSGEPLPAGDDPEPVIFVELFYPFASRPASLTLGAPRDPTPAGIGFVAYHQGLPVNDFRYLGGGYVLDLDWDDPWYSSFRMRQLRRAYYAAMNGFIYVEPYEVRKEIIVRPRDLQNWVDLGLEDAPTIAPAAQPELKRRVAAFLREHHAVVIDGERTVPDLARINFLRRTLRNSTVIDPPEELDVNSATLGVIFVYATEGLPESVTMEWDLFNDRIDVVPVAAVDQAGPLPSILTPDYPVLEWQNFLQNPELPTLAVTEAPPGTLSRAAGWLRWVFAIMSILVIAWLTRGATRGTRPGAAQVLVAIFTIALTVASFWLGAGATMDGERSRKLVTDLLHNVYLAFDFRGEERIYDVLENSVHGDLLTDIYLETRRGLEIANQGGARAKVKDLELIELETEPGSRGGFMANATWNVYGSVGHWGHVHQRTNQYRATLGIEPVDGVWKLTSLELIEETRL